MVMDAVEAIVPALSTMTLVFLLYAFAVGGRSVQKAAAMDRRIPQRL
jgi:hypothetical protein